jgi:hypothetical protein
MTKRYTHSFDTCINGQFDSEVEDFDEAFNEWISQLPDNDARRTALLNGSDSTKELIRGVSHARTDDNLTGAAIYS